MSCITAAAMARRRRGCWLSWMASWDGCVTAGCDALGRLLAEREYQRRRYDRYWTRMLAAWRLETAAAWAQGAPPSHPGDLAIGAALAGQGPAAGRLFAAADRMTASRLARDNCALNAGWFLGLVGEHAAAEEALRSLIRRVRRRRASELVAMAELNLAALLAECAPARARRLLRSAPRLQVERSAEFSAEAALIALRCTLAAADAGDGAIASAASLALSRAGDLPAPPEYAAQLCAALAVARWRGMAAEPGAAAALNRRIGNSGWPDPRALARAAYRSARRPGLHALPRWLDEFFRHHDAPLKISRRPSAPPLPGLRALLRQVRSAETKITRRRRSAE